MSDVHYFIGKIGLLSKYSTHSKKRQLHDSKVSWCHMAVLLYKNFFIGGH